MSKIQYPSLIIVDGTYFLGNVRKKRDLPEWMGLFYAFGTWGSGTIAWRWSPDGGTTKLDINDLSGNAITSNANDSFNSNFASGATNSDIVKLYAVLTGSTNASLTVGYFDNTY